jgi:hypothetical protein
MQANPVSLHANYLRGALIAAALLACGSGTGIGPDRRTNGLGESGNAGAGQPGINGGAGSPSISGGACPVDFFDTTGAPDPCAVQFGGGAAGGPGIEAPGSGGGGGSGAGSTACISFPRDGIDADGNHSWVGVDCQCTAAANLASLTAGFSDELLALVTHVSSCQASDCCVLIGSSTQAGFCQCEDAAARAASGTLLSCSTIAAVNSGTIVATCP